MDTRQKCCTAVCALMVFAMGAGEATAADSAGLEEIIVVATKRAANVQTVPTAISVVTGAKLLESGAKSLVDVAQLVPGVQVVTANGATTNYFSIRGATQNDFADHQESPVALYL